MSLNQFGNNLNFGIQNNSKEEKVNTLDIGKTITEKMLIDIFHAKAGANAEEIKKKIIDKSGRDGKIFATESEVVEYLNDINSRFYNQDALQDVFESDDVQAIKEVVDFFGATQEHAELAEYFAKLRKRTIDDMTEMQKKRKLENPEFDEEENVIEVYREQIEPQVRRAVFDLVKKGYRTFSSGFWGMENQSITFKEKYFEDLAFSEKLISHLESRGVGLRTLSNAIILDLKKKLTIEELGEIWNSIVVEIPENNK